jgi:NitT/TauT family transport system substrate-binding protein
MRRSGITGIMGFTIMVGALAVLLFVAANASAAEEHINYRLKWLINMSTVGDVYAQVNGFFEKEGLAVDVKPGGPERDAIRELELGYAQFGVASADQVIRALEKGSPLVVIAQLFQVNPLHWIYRHDKITINKLDDLKGKVLGVTFGKNDEIIMRTLMAQAGLGENDVRLFSVRLDYTPFYSGSVDLWPVYINTQGVDIGSKMKAAGEQIAFFNPSDFGVRFVANSVITSARMISEQPDTVRRFARGLLKGWQVSLDPANAAKAIETVRMFDKDTAEPTMQAQLDATRPLIQPDAGTRIGAIDAKAWQQTEAIMLAHKQIARPVDVLKHIQEIR